MHKRSKTIAVASGAALALVLSASADTYTWTGATDANWNTELGNWTVNGASAKWANNTASPHDVVFGSSSRKNINVWGGREIGDFTVNTAGYMFHGTGPLNVHGTVFANKDVSFFTPLGTGSAYNVNVADGAWLRLGANATVVQRVVGRIAGEAAPGLDYPTNTHVLASIDDYPGLVVLDPGAGVTNDVGTLSVRSSLIVSSGVVRVSSGVIRKVDGTGVTNGGNSLILVGGNGSDYNAMTGRLVVATGAEIATPAETWGGDGEGATNGVDRFVQVHRFGQVEIFGRVWMPNVCWYNAYATDSKLTIGDGGDVCLGTLHLNAGKIDGSPVAMSVVNLDAGGTLRLRNFEIGSSSSGYPVAINFNGGTVRPLALAGTGLEGAKFRGEKNAHAWKNVSLNVLAGGAVFKPVEAYAFCNRPLKSGVAAGETDGGLTVHAGNTFGFILTVSGSDYNGPTRVECVEGASGTLQVRATNALPGGTTLQIGPKAQAHFTDYTGTAPNYKTFAQTIARLEGRGRLVYNEQLSVTNGVAPIFDGQYGVLEFDQPCNLAGDLEITGDANECGRVKFKAAGQSLAGLTLKMANPAAFATDKGKTFYKVVDAPNGYGDTRFAATDLPPAWGVRYEATAVYLYHIDATVLTFK